MNTVVRGSILVAALLFATTLAADVIYDNGSFDGANAQHSDYDETPPGVAFVMVGDTFTLSSADTVRSIKWWGVYFDSNSAPADDDFKISMFTVTAGVPAASPFFSTAISFEHRTDTGSNIGALDVYEYTAGHPDVPLAAGDYLLSIVNNTPTSGDDWYWATAGFTGTSYTRDNDGDSWDTLANQNFAFQLDDTVPEPSSLTLIALGSICTLGVRMRRRR